MFDNLKIKIAIFLHKKLQEKIVSRQPDFIVGDNYLKRWWIIPRNPIFNVYYHNFKMSDDDRCFHDHMYCNISFILSGKYIEHLVDSVRTKQVGDLSIRLPKTLHRIELPKNTECWTLFITGPRVRNWGFQVGHIIRNWLGFKTKSGWMDHESYIEKFGEQ